MKSKIWKQFTKYILPVLALVIAVSAAVFRPEGEARVLADTTSGTCGDNATWSFDEESGVLTISGTGAMYDFDAWNKPWKNIKDFVETVRIEDEITYIGNSAFRSCENITDLTIGEGVTSIGESAFRSCKGLTEVDIPGSVTSIGESAFYSCKGLTEVAIPGSVTSIGKSAFQYCENITDLTIGEGVTSIGESAFYSCKGLTEVVIPGSVTSIGNSALEFCENITDLTIGEGVTSIGESAFKSCKGLTEVVIPGSVTSIGNSAFESCENITDLTIGEGVTSIGESAFRSCKGLMEVVIPNSVTSIGKSAFLWCENISSLTIGSGVTSIGESAFCSCKGLTEVVIPGSVTSIGQDVFWSCSNITNVYCYADPEKLSWTERWCDDFSGRSGEKSTKCHVFPEYLQTYKDKFDSEVNVEFVGDLSHDVDLGLGGTLYGYSLSLEGDIGVKFYMDLTGVDLSSNPYMEFTVPNGSKAEKQTVTLEDAETVVMAEKTYYTFKCRISAKDSSSIIQAQMLAGEEKSEVYAFSVKSYAEYIISHRTDDQYARSAPLAEALLTYCTCAQKYFGVNMAALDESYIDDQILGAVTSIPDPDPHVVIGGDLTNATFEGATLSLKTETTLSLYFRSDIDLTFSCSGGKTVEKAQVGGYQVARIRGIKASELGTKFTLTVSQKTDGFDVVLGTINYSALQYCKSVVDGDYNADLTNVAKSLYLYYEAAKAYASSST